MKLTPRDRWLCVALPAALTLLFCEGRVVRGIRRESAALRTTVTGRGTIAALTAKLGPARAEGERLNSELAPLRAQAAAGGSDMRAAVGRRSEALREVSRLCESRSVTLLDVRPAGASTSGAALEGLSDAWRLGLRGTYSDVQGLIADLSASGAAVPVGVGLEPGDGDDGKPDYWVLCIGI